MRAVKEGCAVRGGAHGHRGTQRRGARGNRGLTRTKGHVWPRGGTVGRRARPWGTYVRGPIDGHGLTPRRLRRHICACQSLEERMGGTHASKSIYILPSSFEVAKPSPRGSLLSTCKVLCLGFWRLGDLTLHT